MTVRSRFDLQAWLEERAQGPVYVIAATSMIMRAALFYSGQGANFERFVGPFGMGIINGVTAIGLAAGGELLASIAGRSWKRNRTEAREAFLRRDLKATERETMATHFNSLATIDFYFMLTGVAASFIAALSYMWVANPDHSIPSVLSEVVLTSLLIAIMTYLGVFKEARRKNAAEARAARADALSDVIVDGAGQRIAAGKHTIQDVRVFARNLPTKADRDRFLAAFNSETPDDPHWRTNDIVAWLGNDSPAVKRQVTRKLAKLADAGVPVMRDEKNAYMVPRSQVFLHFADDFLKMARESHATPSARSISRQSGPFAPQQSTQDRDAGATTTGASHGESPVVVAASGAA